MRLIGILLLSVLLPACQGDAWRYERSAADEFVPPRGARPTAEDLRGMFPAQFDFSRPYCVVWEDGEGVEYLTVKILGGRRDEIVSAVYEAMDAYGFAPLPENPRVPSEGRYILPDDAHHCYFMWYGIGADDMMLAPHTRWLGDVKWYRPPWVWNIDAFVRVLRSKLSARGLSRLVQIDTTRILSHEPEFYEEYKASTGPEHCERYDEHGDLFAVDGVVEICLFH